MADAQPEYIAARTVLLDALDALGSQREAIVIVGAQAIYLRTGSGGIAGFAPYTTDADLALEPSRVTDEPLIERLMDEAHFEYKGNPGIWWKSVQVEGNAREIEVDLMVPERFAPPGGRRSARLPPHHPSIARKAIGLEGSMLDYDSMEVKALEDSDGRRFVVRVAGPAALVVAKTHKISDRLSMGRKDRIADKDAADVYRLMLSVPIPEVVRRLQPLLDDERAGPVCREAVELTRQLFGARAAVGVEMATRSLTVAVPPERVADVCTSFTRQLLEELAGA